MRFIDLEQLEPRVRELLPPLAEAQQQLMAEADPAGRRTLIDEYRGRWVALRDAFEEFSNGKCWYVECRNPGTDNDIDHFRPKLRSPSTGVICASAATAPIASGATRMRQ